MVGLIHRLEAGSYPAPRQGKQRLLSIALAFALVQACGFSEDYPKAAEDGAVSSPPSPDASSTAHASDSGARTTTDPDASAPGAGGQTAAPGSDASRAMPEARGGAPPVANGDAGMSPGRPDSGIVDAGPGVPPREEPPPQVTDCPLAQPAQRQPCRQVAPFSCEYDGVVCECDLLYGGWNCTSPDGCSAGPAPGAYCPDENKRCEFAGDVSCECLPSEPEGSFWSCIGPTGCPISQHGPRCDPELDVYCDYQTGHRCRCTEDGYLRCVQRECGFDPREGEPCTSSPPEGCQNDLDETCLCSASSDQWICNPLKCPGTEIANGTQCYPSQGTPPTCEYADVVCECSVQLVTSFWVCEEKP